MKKPHCQSSSLSRVAQIGFGLLVTSILWPHNASAIHPLWIADTLEVVRVEDMSMAVDSSGNLHIAYVNRDTGNPHYGKYIPGGSWTSEPISLSMPGIQTSTAIGPSGQPIVAFHSNDSLIVARRSVGGAWSIEVADPHKLCGGGNTAVAVDDTGGVHVLYHVNCSHYRYVWEEGGAWNTYTTLAGMAWEGADLKINPSGDAVMAWSPAVGIIGDYIGRLSLFTRAGSSWVVEIVDTSRAQSDLFFDYDSAGLPRILDNGFSFWGAQSCDHLGYREYDGVSWSYSGLSTICINDLGLGGYRDAKGIDIATDGTPHTLSVRFQDGSHVEYKVRRPGGWTSETVVSGVRSELPFVLGDQDIPYIVYAPTGQTPGLILAFRDSLLATTLPKPIDRDFVLLTHPNPLSTGSMLITIPDSRVSGGVTVSVYDVRGRLVRVLASRDSRARTLSWAGRGDKGNPLPSGPYFVRAVSGDRTFTRKIALVR